MSVVHDTTSSGEREQLIQHFAEQQLVLLRLMARDRFAPLLQTELTIQQLKLLLITRLEGPQSGHELAELLGVSTATVSGLVDRMVERGVLERREDPTDRRVRRVAPSPAGEELLEEMERAEDDMRGRLLRRLDLEQLRHLVVAMREMARIAVDDADTHTGGPSKPETATR